jgi:hypothetical protein
MAFLTSTTQTTNQPAPAESVDNSTVASLLSMVVLSVYAAKKSTKNFRRLKRQFLWTAFKLKAKSLFKRNTEVSDKTLIYILLGVFALVLVIVAPLFALVLAAVVLILILTGVL